jgi:hypothetical protein
MQRTPKPQLYDDILLAKWVDETGPEAARAKAVADLAAGALPPWNRDEDKEIRLTSCLVRERLRRELPEPGKTGGGRLYVLGFQGLRPVVKMGSTGNPEQQFAKYEIQARNLGYALVDGWVSAPVGTRKEAYKQETIILGNLHMVLNGHIVGGPVFEWFHGHDFEQIRDLVRHPDVLLQQYLSMSRATEPS